MSLSYIEVYNEQIRDLITPSKGVLDLREATNIIIYREIRSMMPKRTHLCSSLAPVLCCLVPSFVSSLRCLSGSSEGGMCRRCDRACDSVHRRGDEHTNHAVDLAKADESLFHTTKDDIYKYTLLHILIVTDSVVNSSLSDHIYIYMAIHMCHVVLSWVRFLLSHLQLVCVPTLQ